MTNIIFDSFALIRFFRKEPNYEVVRNLLAEVASGQKTGYLSVINLGEVYYMLCRKENVRVAKDSIQKLLHLPLHFPIADAEACLSAAMLKAQYLISYADAFAAALTIREGGTLITGDPEFKHMTKLKGFKVSFI